MARTLRLQLKRGLTYRDGTLVFRRGTPIDIPDEQTYHRLLRTGYLTDPEQQFNYINHNTLKKARPGQEVVIIRDMGMGDVLMVSLAIQAVAKKWPHLRFVYAVDGRYVPLFQHCDFLHAVIPITDLTGRHDFVIDLRGLSEMSAERHVRDRIEIFGMALGVNVEDFTYPYYVTPEEKRFASQKLSGQGIPIVGVVVRGSTGLRSWPFVHVMDFCRRAVSRGWGAVLLDQELIPLGIDGVLNLTGTLGIRELAAVISQCDVLVAPDTGPMHLAEAVRTPCVAIFSTIDPAVRVTHYENVFPMWRGHERNANGSKVLSCCPCWERGCADLPCLNGITPDAVIEKARNIVMQTVGAKEA
jgi:ADP-heptose:LPS heptosyltransferase